MLEPLYVTSSNIDALGHDGERLFIRFKSGITYAYDEVPRHHFDAMPKSESVGQYFHRYIKNAYRYERLTYDPFIHAAHPMAA